MARGNNTCVRGRACACACVCVRAWATSLEHSPRIGSHERKGCEGAQGVVLLNHRNTTHEPFFTASVVDIAMSSDAFPSIATPPNSGAPSVAIDQFLLALHGPPGQGTASGDDLSQFKPRSIALDVRSPSEYTKGHIPGAISAPLFDDEERAVVGTTFTQRGKYEAIKSGVDLIGGKLSVFFTILEGLGAKPGDKVYVYCWRGGMRSGSVAWLLTLCGFDVSKLEGGYRSYRRWCRRVVGVADAPHPCPIMVIGGCTGSGKTAILMELQRRKEQVLDLEGLANHRGSAFGAMGQAPQPSNEWYENMIALTVRRVDPSRQLWIEHEGLHVGSCSVPAAVHRWVITTPDGAMIVLNMDKQMRAERLVEDYCSANSLKEAGWIDAMRQIISLKKGGLAKKLGGQNVKKALELLEEAKFQEVASMMLDYYDKLYRTWVEKSQSSVIKTVDCPSINAETNTELVLECARSDAGITAHAQMLTKEHLKKDTTQGNSEKQVALFAVEGTCHCGEIKVKAMGEPRSVSYCHCSICRKLSGAPFTCQALYLSSQVSVEISPGGRLSGLKTSKGVDRQRCMTCLSPVKASLFNGKCTAVPLQMISKWHSVPGSKGDFPSSNASVGSILAPKHHMHYKNRVMDVVDGLPKYAGAVRFAGSKPTDLGKQLIRNSAASVGKSGKNTMVLTGELIPEVAGEDDRAVNQSKLKRQKT